MKAKLIKTEKGYHLDTGSFDGIHLACYPHDVTKQRLSLKNCQAIERGYNLDELADFYSTMTVFIKKDEIPTEKQIEDAEYISEIAFKAGFKKALELMGDKKFSVEDVMLGWDAGVMSQSICFTNYFGLKRESELKSHRESYQGNLKPSALQQTEWDVEIIEFTADNLKSINNEWHKLGEPKLDADGCLILKRI